SSAIGRTAIWPLTADPPPTPRPCGYERGGWRSVYWTVSGQWSPRRPSARVKFGPLTAAGVSAERESGPASTSRTVRDGSSDNRAAIGAPAAPAPMITTSNAGDEPPAQPLTTAVVLSSSIPNQMLVI